MSNQKQFVNIIRSNQNIKIDNQILENDSIISSSQSVFLLQDNLFSSDTLFKLQSLEQNIKNTYISSLCESKEQRIVPKIDAKNKNATYIPFDSNNMIELNNTIIETATLFNNNGNIDYLISPFTLLQNFLLNNLEANSINMLIHNDNIYTIILGEDKRFIDYKILSITPFNEVKNSEFYKDEVVEQKLYDEIYLLELTDLISNTIKEYYEKFNNTNFVEKINLFYTMKQLEDEQISTLENELMLTTNYQQIHLDALLFDVTGRSNVTKYSFIAPRSKKTTLSITTWLIIALVSLIVVFSVIYFMMDKKEEIPQQKENNLEKIKVEEKETPQKSKVIKEIQLPDHGTNNQEMVTLIKKIFDTIDEKSVLKEIQIQEDESTMICDFFTPKAQEKFINKSILEVYEKSEVVLMSSNNDVLTTIVSNNTLLDLPKQESKHYTKSQQTFMDDLASHKFLQELLGNDITIVFEDEIISKYSTQIFSITANIKEPVHFYKIMDVINNQNYSITLDYPIEFIKTNETLEVTFVLNINQTLPNKDK